MLKSTELDLAMLSAERQRLTQELRRLDIEIGRRADQALTSEEHISKSAIGRVLGVSHTHVSNLVAASQSAPTPARGQAIPVMENTTAGDYVTSVGARITRCVSGFTPSDVLARSGLDPRLFAEDDRQRLNVPHMLWELDSGQWVGVDMANVGYGGTGCTFSRNALTRAGVADDIADRIVTWRFCDAKDIDNPDTWETSQVWPVQARSIPMVLDDRMIVLFGDALPSLAAHPILLPSSPRPPIDETGFYPSATARSHVEAWLDFLDDAGALPDWARGPRIARVFRNDDVAAEQGFSIVSSLRSWSPRDAHPTLVIEQGKVQLWGCYYRPADATRYIPDEAYEILNTASVYPTSLVNRDHKAARPWSRFIASFVPQHDGLPDSLDISHSGVETLSYTPSAPIEHS